MKLIFAQKTAPTIQYSVGKVCMFKKLANSEYCYGTITSTFIVFLCISYWFYTFASDPWREFAQTCVWTIYCVGITFLLGCGITNLKKIRKHPIYQKCMYVFIYFIAPFLPHLWLYSQFILYLIKN